MEKEKKYFRELKKKVDIYFVIILSMLSSLSIYMLYERKFLNQENIYVLMAILTISLIIYIFSIRKNFKSKNINELDKAILFSNIILITSFFMIIIIKSIKNRELLLIYNLTKRLIQRNIAISFTIIITSVIIILTLLSIILMIIRFYYFFHKNKLKENENKFYTLSDILSEPIPKYTLNDDSGYIEISNIKYRLIKDNYKAGKDLFGRKLIIDNLYYSIDSSTKYSDCFTIGIVGEWGSGKSTIIKLTKKELENQSKFIIIDDFDSWTIKSQDALILAMYNTIMENLGENIGYFKRKKVQNALINISTNIPYIGKGIGSYFENRIDDYTEYKEIKSDLEEKLKKSKKRLVFIIDNLDRMKSDNVIFLLTLIETLFKLPNITYIVAYDRNRLKKIFRTDKIDPKYIEKIISKEILVPKIHNLDKQIIFYNCLKNSLPYNIKKEIVEMISSKFDNIRDFIRFLNFIVYDMHNTNLDKSDFLIIRTIEFLDYNLYNKLYINKNFVTKRKNYLEDLQDKEKIFYEQVKASNFFDLLQYLSLGFSNFNIMNAPKNFFDFGNLNCLCNENYFENYFSKSEYTKEYIRIKEYFNYTNINYEYVKNFFDEDKLYLNKDYIRGLNNFLKEISPIKNNKNLLIFQLSTYIYFLEKIVNGALNDYNVIDTEEYSDYIEYTIDLEVTFTTIINSSNFNYLNLLDYNIFSSGEFYTFINYHNHITYEIKNDNNVENIEKSKKIIENSNKHISNCKLFIDNKNIAQKNTPQENIQYMAESLCNLYKETERYRYRYKYKEEH